MGSIYEGLGEKVKRKAGEYAARKRSEKEMYKREYAKAYEKEKTRQIKTKARKRAKTIATKGWIGLLDTSPKRKKSGRIKRGRKSKSIWDY